MRKQDEPYLTGTLTVMINVVFLLILFFVCAVSFQNTASDDSFILKLASDGKAVPAKDPREVRIDVNKDGSLSLARQTISPELLGDILKKTVSDCGNPELVPVVLRGDDSVQYEKLQGALDACSRAGIVKIRFAALREKRR